MVSLQSQWPETFVISAPKMVASGIGDLLWAGFDYTLCVFNL
jgi:hypothetical protein